MHTEKLGQGSLTLSFLGMLRLKMTHMFTLGRSVDAMNSFPILVIVTMVLSVWLPEKISLMIYIHDQWKSHFWSFWKKLTYFWNVPSPPVVPWSILVQLQNENNHASFQISVCVWSNSSSNFALQAISYHRPHGHLWNDLSRLLTIPVSVRLQKLAAQPHLM